MGCENSELVYVCGLLPPATDREVPPSQAEKCSVWALDRLRFEADAQQSRVLDWTAKRGILNCTRQWGKSTVAAAKAVHRAGHEAESLVLVASPSSRPSRQFLAKAAAFGRP